MFFVLKSQFSSQFFPQKTAPANVQTADVFLLQPQSSSTLAQREGDRLAARLTDIAMERSTHAINR